MNKTLTERQIADAVNTLRDIAIRFHDTQQLRERIAAVVTPLFAARPGQPETTKEFAARQLAGMNWQPEPRAEVTDELAMLRNTLTSINGIRNSIIGLHTLNWSEHVNPLTGRCSRRGWLRWDGISRSACVLWNDARPVQRCRERRRSVSMPATRPALERYRRHWRHAAR